MLNDTSAAVVNACAILGVLYIATLTYRFLSFFWIYFIRPSSVKKYLTSPAPYALITGASDGIGKSVAKELYRRGFNIILHGRNEDKIRKVAEEIKASGGSRDVRYFLADATAPIQSHDFEQLLGAFRDLNITLVINNVGGTPVKMAKVDEWSEDEVLNIVRWNALFPLFVTRALLPQLRKASGPVLIMFVGSYAGDVPPPRISLYAASKRFIEFFGRGLSMDERYFTPSNIQVQYLCVGEVSTNAVRKPTSFVRPDSDTFARALVNRIGCGRRRLAPYIGHAVSQWFVGAFGVSINEIIVGEAMRQMYLSGGTKED